MRRATTFTVIACLLASPVASAQVPRSDDERAHDLSDSGMAAFHLGHYHEAIEAFRESFQLSRRPQLLFNLGQAYRLNGDCQLALESYRAYLDALPAAPNRGRVESWMADLPCARESAPAPGEPAPPPVAPARPPAPAPAPAPPPAPPPAPAPAPAKAPAERSHATLLRALGIAALAAGIAAGGAGVWSSLRARDANDLANERYRTGGGWDPAAQEAEATGRNANVTAAVLYPACGVAIAGGALLLLLGGRSTGPGRVNVTVSAHGALGGYVIAF